MRKYVVGFLCGLLLSTGTTVIASSSVQAVISPIKYVIHGKPVAPEGDNVTLNYKGRAYVPIRFVAENSGDIVAYDEKSKTVTIDDQFNIFHNVYYGRIGHLKVTKSGKGSTVTGKVFLSEDELINIPYTGSLGFFDREGKWLGKADFTTDSLSTHDQIRNIHALSEIDLSNFKTAVLIYSSYEYFEATHAPPGFALQAKSGNVAIGTTVNWNTYPSINGFTRIDARVAIDEIGTYDLSATLTFYDADGRELATAPVEGRVNGKVAASDYWKHEENIQDKILMAKGDIAGWKSVKLTVHSLQKVD